MQINITFIVKLQQQNLASLDLLLSLPHFILMLTRRGITEIFPQIRLLNGQPLLICLLLWQWSSSFKAIPNVIYNSLKQLLDHYKVAIHTSYFPRFGFCFPAKIFKAVDFPIPFVPTKPSTSPGRGIGNLHKVIKMQSIITNKILHIPLFSSSIVFRSKYALIMKVATFRLSLNNDSCQSRRNGELSKVLTKLHLLGK